MAPPTVTRDFSSSIGTTQIMRAPGNKNKGPRTPSILNVTLSNDTFTGGSPSGTTVGTITVSVSQGLFGGTLNLTGADASSFQVVGNQLKTNGVVAAGNYSINIVATDANFLRSPTAIPFVITGSGGATQSFTSLSLTNTTFTPNGSTPVTVGSVVAVLNPSSPPATGATVAISDTTNFQLTNGGVYPCDVQAKAATGTGTYSGITLTITEVGVTNSPYTSSPFSITGATAFTLETMMVTNTSGSQQNSAVDTPIFGSPFKKRSGFVTPQVQDANTSTNQPVSE